MKQSEILDVLKKEFNLTAEHVKLIETHLWHAIRYYITNPLEAKGRILIPGSFTFYIPKYKLNRYLKDASNKIENNKETHNLEFYNKLKAIIETYERQAHGSNNDERHD